jgi:hypothetical protein
LQFGFLMRQEEKKVLDLQSKSLEELPKHNFSAFLSIIARICQVTASATPFFDELHDLTRVVLLLVCSLRRRSSATSGRTATSTRFEPIISLVSACLTPSAVLPQLLLADLNEGGGGLGGGRLSGPAVSLDSPLLVHHSSLRPTSC